MNLIDQINSHSHLYLNNLIDNGDLKIELSISEASSECWDTQTNNITDLTEVEKAEVIKRRPCKKYKIIFDEYISCSIRNESFTIWDNYEIFTGNLLRVYSKSRFLDYCSVAVDSFIIGHTQENKIKHFGIICLNNIIDIATYNELTIEEII